MTSVSGKTRTTHHKQMLIHKKILIKKHIYGDSLVVQWLRIKLPMQGTWVQPLVGELRYHMPWDN